MSDKWNSFDVAGPTRINVTSRSGDVIVGPSDGNVVTVLLSGAGKAIDAATVDATTGSVSVRTDQKHQGWSSKGVDVLITAPPGGAVRVRSGSGDIVVQIPMETVDVNTGSGDVRIEHPLNELRAKVASGDVTVDGIVSKAVVTSASGSIRIAEVEDVVVKTASGSVDVGSAMNTVRIKSASGDVKVRTFGGAELSVKTMSGDVTVGLVPGLEVAAKIKAMSGEFRNQTEPSDAESVHRTSLDIKSFSGDVTLKAPW